eukprot:TRINITY_DN3972_c0_g1_i2.p1 TRINITY_DN3972_c0_g1~~TRINITY_DN3972_c0_g1_i2.p1  ORF type:complete len:235 (-),score=33.96 TRINITY_DN3972_c0_g1_i2:39-743(-)
MRFFVFLLISQQPLMQAGQHGHAHAQTHTHTGPMRRTQTNDSEDTYKVSVWSGGSCGTGTEDSWEMVGLGGGCFKWTWDEDMGSFMPHCNGTDEKVLVRTYYSSLDCTGPPSGSDSVPKTYLSEPSCWMYEWDGDILHEKLDRPVLPQHLPSCMVKPRDESMTCGELKDMYKQAGCCGNPNKELKVPDSRRMASSDPENLLEALRTALDEVKLTQGPKAAADLAAQVLRSVRSP